jgi:hypothetical protein
MPVDRAATIEKYNYDPALLVPGSDKKVVYVCDTPGCNRVGARKNSKARGATYCKSCAVKRVASVAKVARNKTWTAKYGTSHPMKTESVRKKFTDTMLSLYDVPHALQNAEFRDKSRKKKPRKKRTYALPPELPIDELATLDYLGYRATDVAPGLFKNVVFICRACKDYFPRPRRLMTEDATCRSCSATARWAESRREILAKAHETVLRNNASQEHRDTEDEDVETAESAFAAFIRSTGVAVQRRVRIPVQTTAGDDTVWELDVVVPEKMIAFEYCSLYWHNEHSPNPRTHFYHRDKMRAAASLGYQLITVFEDEWLMRREQVEGVIRAKLNSPTEVVGGRECIVQAVDLDRVVAFINLNHVQKLDRRPLAAWGLLHGDRMIAALTLEPDNRRSKKKNGKKQGAPKSVSLNRLCFAAGIRVSGGASKLFAVARQWAQEQKYASIVTWSDNRWSDGRVYQTLGFTLARDGGPDYKYVSVQNPHLRFGKETYKKSRTGCPKGIHEDTWNLEQHGMARIWDCGLKRWEIVL